MTDTRTLKDAVYGLAVGDAMGLPVQFKARDTYYVDTMTGNGSFDLPRGCWSDDTSLTLATCYSIKRKHKIDLEDIRNCFEAWLYDGQFTPTGYAYDIGGTCKRAIMNGYGVDDKWANGNGSLMRIIPLAFVENISDDEIANVSALTHAHKISKDGCIRYVRIAKDLISGKTLRESIKERITTECIYSKVLEIENYEREQIESSVPLVHLNTIFYLVKRYLKEFQEKR